MDKDRQYFQLHKNNYEKIINRLGSFTDEPSFSLNIPAASDKNRQIYLLHKTAYEEILKRLQKINDKPPVIVTGIDGKDGKDAPIPVKGVDYFTEEEKDVFIASILSKIPPPEPGKPGKDAKPIDYEKIEKIIDDKLSAITIEKPEKIDVQTLLDEVKSAIPKPVPVDYKSLRKYIKEEIETIENNRESRVRMLHSAGPSTRLEELTNVAKNFSNGDLVGYQDGKFIPTSQVSPGGSDTQVQFNDGGSFGGDAGFTYNKTTNSATLTGNLSVSDDPYAAGWNGSTNVPTKNAVYDKIQSLVTGVSSVSNSDGSLTISPTTGNVVASLNLAHGNTWSIMQGFDDTFGNAAYLANTAGSIGGSFTGVGIAGTFSTSNNTYSVSLASNSDFAAGYFSDVNFGSYAYLGFGSYGGYASGASDGFYAQDSSSQYQAYLGSASNSAAAYFYDTPIGVSTYINDSNGYGLNTSGYINTSLDYYIGGSPIGVSHWSNDAGYLTATVQISQGGTGTTSFGANRIPYINSGNTAFTSSANFASFTNTSRVFIGNETTTTNKVLTLRGMASQSGNLLEFQNSAGTQLTFFDSVGNYNFQSTSSSTVGVIFKGGVRFIHTYASGGGQPATDYNLFIGYNAGNFTMSGATANTGIGEEVLDALTSGDFNTGVGRSTLTAVTTGQNNNGIGNAVLAAITTGSNNNGMGNAALLNLATSSSGNTGVGSGAGRGITSATDLTFIGKWAGYPNDTNGAVLSGLSNSTAIGANANVHISNAVVLGSSGENGSTAVSFGGIGTASPAAMWHVIKTSEQLRLGYDTSNYFSTTVGSTGGVTFNAVGAGANFTFSDDVELDGALNHDGTTIGFNGATPVTQSTGWSVTAAYTTLKSFDPTTATLTEALRVIATLIDYLKSRGDLGA